jgi:AcrR family transcriptional regulator
MPSLDAEPPPTVRARTRRAALPREHAQEAYRARIVRATLQVAAEEGLGRATLARVLVRAEVSRGTFSTVFDDMGECVMAILDHAMRRSVGAISQALAGEAPWFEKPAAGLAALLDFLDSDPLLARFCLVEALAAGPAALEYRARELGLLAHTVDGVLGHAEGRGATLLSAEAVVASVAGILHARVVQGEAPPFIDLLPALLDVVLAPYLDGEARAREVERATRLVGALAAERAARPPVPPAVPIPRWLANPTAHRMRSCLLDVAVHPDTSNRAVAARIGVEHLSQVSHLLGRLAAKGVLVKRGRGTGRVNAWTVTPEGQRLAQALRQAG